MAPWAADYVGLPFRDGGRGRDGLDCWGLVVLVCLEQAAIRLPGFNGRYMSTEDRDDIERLIQGHRAPWRDVAPGAERPLDVIGFAVMGKLCHVGVVVGDGRFLHAETGAGVVMDRYQGIKWRRRLAGGGIVRHEALLNA